MTDTCIATPVGTLRIEETDGFITSVKRVDAIASETPPSALCAMAAHQLQEYFFAQRNRFELPLKPAGTDFQKRVWDAVLQIPYGQVRSYAKIAEAIGKPGAARAVGAACRNNPIWIVIPCHRVIGKNGSDTGYAGGLPMKRALLELEQCTSAEII